MNTKRNLGRLLVSVSVLALSACGSEHDDMSSTNTVADSLVAMDSLITKFPTAIGFHDEMKHWGFALPGGDKIEWTTDTAANVADFAFVLAAQPLIDAGVDSAKLEKAGWMLKAADAAMGTPALLIRPVELDAAAAGAGAAKDTASSAFARLVNRFSAKIGFHHELSHFGFAMPSGDKFEWTKDLAANDADMAFVFVAQPLVDAGANVDKLKAAGWMYSAAAGTTPALLIKPYKLN